MAFLPLGKGNILSHIHHTTIGAAPVAPTKSTTMKYEIEFSQKIKQQIIIGKISGTRFRKYPEEMLGMHSVIIKTGDGRYSAGLGDTEEEAIAQAIEKIQKPIS